MKNKVILNKNHKAILKFISIRKGVKLYNLYAEFYDGMQHATIRKAVAHLLKYKLITQHDQFYYEKNYRSSFDSMTIIRNTIREMTDEKRTD